ncbi:MAG: branched-chain amino acid ABC transporter permease [Kiritimatiellaeota bacterium]|nr:branched-chain amino acid ABC transporter permease [Kiritimatiellota bacterium]
MAAYTAAVVMGLSLLVGYTGQISLGHAGFVAIGAYTSAFLSTAPLAHASGTALGKSLLRFHVLASRPELYGDGTVVSLAPGLAFLAGLLLAGLVAVGIGYPALRLHGHYLAMATLGFGLIVYRLVLGTAFLGAADGISSVPPLPILPGVACTGEPGQRIANYYIAAGFTLMVLLFLLNLTDSRTGRALRAIHGSERAAAATGIDTAAYKLKVFVLSAILAAAAGGLLTFYRGSIGPSDAGAMKSVRYVAMVAAGGMASVWGALVVGFVLTFLSLRGCFGSFDDAVFGVVLIVIMSFTPEGPFGPLRTLVVRFRARRRPALANGESEKEIPRVVA